MEANTLDTIESFPSEAEEILNGLTHGIGFILSLIGCVTLIFSSLGTTLWHVIGCSVYALTLVSLYGASTGYHLFNNPKLKKTFRVLDHSCIYLLIAGTYTPVMLTSMRSHGGLVYLAVVWSIAILGIIFKVFFTGRFNAISTLSYVVAGWIAILSFGPLLQVLSLSGFLWLTAGGVAYTGGVIFFINDHKKYYHAIWHCFVLLGSACQFVSILFFVLPK